MKKFVLKSAVFLGIFLVMNLLLFEWLTRPILYRDYVRHKYNNIGKYNKVLFSDSRGESILQQDLDKAGVYNFSLGSDNYRDILFRIIYLHSHYPGIDTIILGLDKHMLSGYRENLNNNNRSVFYLDGSTRSSYIPYSRPEVILRQAWFFLPFLDTKNAELYYLALKSRLNKLLHLEPPVSDPLAWHQHSKPEQRALAQGRIKLQFPYARKSVILEKYLQQIIDYCKENHLILIGLNFPLTRAYLNLQDQIQIDPNELFRENKLPIIDLSHSLQESDSLFLNADHLNDSGSAEFVKGFSLKMFFHHIGT